MVWLFSFGEKREALVAVDVVMAMARVGIMGFEAFVRIWGADLDG